MFCSKCGKTLTLEDRQCPHCGNPVGESRFEGTPYTSAQPRIVPNAPVKAVTAAYTRTTYTTIPEDRQQEGAVDSRTTYRPVYEGASASEEVRRDMRAAINGTEEQEEQPSVERSIENLSEEARGTLNAVEEELKMEEVDTSELHTRPIESTGRAGISAGVEDYIQKLEASQTRRARRRSRNAESVVDEGEYVAPQGQPDYDGYGEAAPEDTEQSEVFDDIDEEEFDEMRYGRTLGLKDILKVALIMVLAAALIVGGVLWFRHVRGSTSSAKIEGVTETLYNDGIAMIKSHADTPYISELVDLYASSGSLGLASRITTDSAAIDALLPAEPATNDPLFISALQTIQTNIGNAVLMDAQTAASGTSDEAASQARWGIVNGSITQLEAATSAAELTAILNGETVTVAAAEPTPSPTPEPVNYETLAKGAKSDAVLELQNRLYELGFLMDDRDGAFGNKTQTAVKSFQEYAGLNATGIADSQTQALLFSDDAPRTEFAQTTPPPLEDDISEDDGDYADDNEMMLSEDEEDNTVDYNGLCICEESAEQFVHHKDEELEKAIENGEA